IGRHLVDLAAAPRERADKRGAAGQMAHVAGKLAAPKHRDGPWRLGGFSDDFDLARLHDEELEVALTDRDELLPGRVVFERCPSATPERDHLGLVEDREGGGMQVGWDHGLGSSRRVVHLLSQPLAWAYSVEVGIAPRLTVPNVAPTVALSRSSRLNIDGLL